MKHCYWSAILALFVGAFPIFAQVSNGEKPRKVRFDIEIRGMVWGVPRYVPRIINVPVALRQVPGHKDDFPDGGVIITVPDASINPQRFANVGAAAAPGIIIGERVSLRTGVHWAIPVAQGAQPKNAGNTREINLEGRTDRGIGTSLVYYSVQYSASHPGFFGEVEARVSKRYSVLAGYLASYNNLTIERGWDRFNALQQSDRRHLASVQMHAPYLGFRIFDVEKKSDWLGLGLFAGLAYTRLTPGPLAATANIEVSKPGIFLGVSIGKAFGLGKKKTN
jgi:hypothetical protein